MAVTFTQQPFPGTFQASDTPIVYVFSSNQTAQPNFSFIVETLINGAVVSTDMVFPEMGNRGRFDAKQVTLPTIKHFQRSSDTYTSEILPTLRLRVSERYGTVPVTQTPANSGICKLVKACTDDETYATYFLGTIDGWYASKYTPSFQWLTDAPLDENSNPCIFSGRNAPIRASMLITSPSVTWGISFLDAQGNTIATYTEGPYPSTDRVHLYLEPQFLRDVLLGDGLTLEEVHELRIDINTSYSYVVRYIDVECGEFNQVSWLNSLGTYDQFLFTHNRDQRADIETWEYKKQFGSWEGGNFFFFNDRKSGDTQYLKTIKPTGTLYSGYISQEYKRWLNGIAQSLDVLLYRDLNNSGIVTDGFGGNTVEKIVITDTTIVQDKSRFEDLITIEVNYKKSNFKTITL